MADLPLRWCLTSPIPHPSPRSSSSISLRIKQSCLVGVASVEIVPLSRLASSDRTIDSTFASTMSSSAFAVLLHSLAIARRGVTSPVAGCQGPVTS
ncbi:hypothetical protein NL676_000133 [Syzygium grande]|nr:hypothetical protein NL676_000133 [Syzygium grande]